LALCTSGTEDSPGQLLNFAAGKQFPQGKKKHFIEYRQSRPCNLNQIYSSSPLLDSSFAISFRTLTFSVLVLAKGKENSKTKHRYVKYSESSVVKVSLSSKGSAWPKAFTFNLLTFIETSNLSGV